MQVAKPAGPARAVARSGAVVARAAARSNWLPGSDFPAHLEQSKLPGCFGFDPLGLGADPERLVWFAEAERVHARWAMLGVAGILLQVRAVLRCAAARCAAQRAPLPPINNKMQTVVHARPRPPAGDHQPQLVLVHSPHPDRAAL